MPPCLSLAIVVVLSATAVLSLPQPAKLRRIPRIYNALITTDEQLLPSQAYPAVSPVLRPAAYPAYSAFAPSPAHVFPQVQGPYGQLYAPDPYGLQAYSRIPGFNDTLQDPEAHPGGGAGSQKALYTLQAQQTIPQITDMVKNNRPENRDIPDVPPPPLPVSPPRQKGDSMPERKSQEYPPAPLQGLPFL